MLSGLEHVLEVSGRQSKQASALPRDGFRWRVESGMAFQVSEGLTMEESRSPSSNAARSLTDDEQQQQQTNSFCDGTASVSESRRNTKSPPHRCWLLSHPRDLVDRTPSPAVPRNVPDLQLQAPSRVVDRELPCSVALCLHKYLSWPRSILLPSPLLQIFPHSPKAASDEGNARHLRIDQSLTLQKHLPPRLSKQSRLLPFTAMISVASLLNADTSEPRNSQLYPRPHPHYSPVLPPFLNSSSPPGPVRPKMSKEDAGLTKGTITGDVNFPPFEEHLSDDALQETNKYQVRTLGKIRASPKHIPYNSEKKNFWERTGRDSLEVFHYTFQPPDDKDCYTVMWDYNIGLVRITPFFKCYKYSKTTPAKMLNMNKGLKDITHSITGGSLTAQGYWMPYECAKAVCATFCYTLAGALIPIFGPDFPSTCTPRPELDNISWQIEPEIISEATRTAEAFRIQYSTASTNSSASASPSQLLGNLVLGSPLYNQKRQGRPFTDSDNEVSDTSNSSFDMRGASPATPERMLYSGTGAKYSGWTPTQTTYKLGGPLHNPSSRPKRYWAEVSRSRPLCTRESVGLGHTTSVEGRSAVPDGRAASPWLSALPGLISITSGSVSHVVNSANLSESRLTPGNQFVAANANDKVQALSQNASSANSEVHCNHKPPLPRRLEPRRSKRQSRVAQSEPNDDHGYDGEFENSPGGDGDESGQSSLNIHINANRGSSGSDTDEEIECPRKGAMIRRHTNEEREAAIALLQLSGSAFGSSAAGSMGATAAGGTVDIPNRQTERALSGHGSGSGSLGACGVMEMDTDTDSENLGAKRRRIKAL